MTAVPDEPDLDGRCGGPRKHNAGPCTQPAGWGTNHPDLGRCKLHGGATYSHRRHAESERAAAAVVTFGLRRDVGPEEALLEEVQWTAGHVEWLRRQVQDLDGAGLSWGLAEERTGENGGRTFRAGEPVIVKLYREERRHLVDVCRAAAQAGVAERLVRLEEEKGRLLVAGMQWLVGRLGLSEAQLAAWQSDVPVMLRQLAAGAVEGP